MAHPPDLDASPRRRLLRPPATAFSAITALSVALFVLGASGAWYVRHLYQGLADVLEGNVTSVRAAEELEIALREMQDYLNRITYRAATIDADELATLQAQTDRWLAEATRLATTPHEARLMQEVNDGYRHFLGAVAAAVAAEGGVAARADRYEEIDRILTREIIAPAHDYLDFNEATMLSSAQAHRRFAERFSWALLLAGAGGCVGGFCVGLAAARRVRRSLVELNLPLSLAAGKLSEVAGPIRLSTSLDLRELKRVLELLAGEVDQVVARLQRTQAEVLQSEKLAAIGQLAAGTAHEIRNPLMSIKLLVQAGALPGGPGLSSEDLTLIEHEITRLERAVQNLLDFARPPAVEAQPVAIATMLRRAVSLVLGRAKVQGIRIRGPALADDPVVHGDAQQLQQVVVNLLLNALDATPRDGGDIEVLVGVDGSSGAPRVEIAVQDHGDGIPSALLGRVFEPFASSKSGGTGLGLSISRQIVEAHHGAMFARNLPVGGALVGFSLPLAPA
jgi:signal transduction histidine kinase